MWLSPSIFFSKVHLTIHKNAPLQNGKLPTWVWFVLQSMGGLWLRAAGEGFWAHPCFLETETCSCYCQADGRRGVWPCMAFLCCLGGFAQTPSTPRSCSTVRHPNWDGNFMGDSLGSAQHWIKGKLELGRNQCREGKNRKRKDSLVSHEEAGLCQQFPCRAADRNKRGEPYSCTDKMAGRNLSPQFNYRRTLAFLIPSLPAWDMFLHLLDPCPKLSCSPPISFSYSILLFLLKRHQNTWDIQGAGAKQTWWYKSVSPVCSLFLS